MDRVTGVCVTVLVCLGCAAPEEAPEVSLRAQGLEFGCLFAEADAEVELGPHFPSGREILTHSPFAPSTPQDYGSAECSGFIADFDNPNGYTVERILIQGGGVVTTVADFEVFGTAALCASLRLEADVYGTRNGITETLGSVVASGVFEAIDDGRGFVDHCDLSHEIQRSGAFEAIRVVGRVSNRATAYPLRMEVAMRAE